ncbi:MAG: hypothetical protein KKA38_10960 [Euryarchaeota archaeon]|nr:hypothetical protein [Euryarchaeota archaeon]MBV1734245.1 hypothetical protein [Desulforudis sp.]
MELQTQTPEDVSKLSALDEWMVAIPQLRLTNLEQMIQLLETFTPAMQRCEILQMLLGAIECGLKDLKEFKDPNDGIPVVLAQCPYCDAFLGTLPLVTMEAEPQPIDISVLDKTVSKWWNSSDFACPNCKIQFEKLADEDGELH